jgi:hypothetical protein
MASLKPAKPNVLSFPNPDLTFISATDVSTTYSSNLGYQIVGGLPCI